MHISKFYVLSPDASDEGNCAFPAMHLYVSELIFVRTVQMNQLDFCCFTFNRKAFTIKQKNSVSIQLSVYHLLQSFTLELFFPSNSSLLRAQYQPATSNHE